VYKCIRYILAYAGKYFVLMYRACECECVYRICMSLLDFLQPSLLHLCKCAYVCAYICSVCECMCVCFSAQGLLWGVEGGGVGGVGGGKRGEE
jgi:hypothetical protein